MNHSEKLAIAAHLHVLLRRKTGRVTDTEWMASNGSYAREIARFARERAVLDQAPDRPPHVGPSLERWLAPGSRGQGRCEHPG